MSKSDKLREMQDKINHLTVENESLRKKLFEFKERDVAQLGDFIKKKGGFE